MINKHTIFAKICRLWLQSLLSF